MRQVRFARIVNIKNIVVNMEEYILNQIEIVFGGMSVGGLSIVTCNWNETYVKK
jgi:hypothetical protein